MPELRAIAEQHLTVPDHVVSSAGDVIDINSRLATGRQAITVAVSLQSILPMLQPWFHSLCQPMTFPLSAPLPVVTAGSSN